MSEYVYPPGPTAHYPGQLWVAVYKDLLGFLTRVAKEYGDIAYTRLGHTHSVLLNHPDYIRDVLVTHAKDVKAYEGLSIALGHTFFCISGDVHRRERRYIQPLFVRHHLNTYTDVIAAAAEQTRDHWQDGALIDVLHEMMQTSMSVAGRVMLSLDLGDLSDEFSAAAIDGMRYVFLMESLPFGQLIDKIPLPVTHRFHKEQERLHGIVSDVIAERRRTGELHDDIIGRMLAAQKENNEPWLTDTQIRDEVLFMLMAGHETTAIALTWTFYLLAQHPEVEARLHAEIDTVLGDRVATSDDVTKLRYTEMVLAEAIRLYPPSWYLIRTSVRDIEIGDYRLPEGTVFWMCQYALHRHPLFWPDAEKFDPERMAPEARAAQNRYAYLPFGAGPHQCLGEHFAWLEATIVLATVARRWRLRALPGHEAELEPLITLRPRGGMPMTLERRKTD
jgi:cytochrome P450